MKNIFLFFSLLLVSFLASASVTVQGTLPTVTLGGVTVPSARALILSCNGSASARYDSLRLNGAAYTVTTGKTLYLVGYTVSSGAAAGVGVTFGSGTASVANSVSAPAGDQAIVTGGGLYPSYMTPASVGATASGPIYVTIAAGRIPYCQTFSGAVMGTILGYEL